MHSLEKAVSSRWESKYAIYVIQFLRCYLDWAGMQLRPKSSFGHAKNYQLQMCTMEMINLIQWAQSLKNCH